MSVPLSERIANLALDTFSRLPAKCKPRLLPDGRREWTPMSAVVLSHPSRTDPVADEDLKIISLATGTKSLPVSALSKCEGLILHDCHAEILALRGFNRWLLFEMQQILESETYWSSWLESVDQDRDGKRVPRQGSPFPFRLREGTEISLFSTEAPCGDASMELLMAATEAAGRDVTPWARATEEEDITGQLPPGRGCFSNLGALRRKPARADAEISMSKSCTDKLMLKQVTGLLGFPVDLFVEPGHETFLKRMIVYKNRWNKEGYERAFAAQGRLTTVVSALRQEGNLHVNFFQVDTLPEEFRRFTFEKEREGLDGQKSRVSNVAALRIAAAGGPDSGCAEVVEVLLNGVRQGFKQFDHRERKGSIVCRKNMVQEGLNLADRLNGTLPSPIHFSTVEGESSVLYSALKSRSVRPRISLKCEVLDGLGGWPDKASEDDFEISMPLLPS